MIRFECDYTTGAHPKILEALVNSNAEACPGYGVDGHCEHARAMLRELCQTPEAGVHFLVGGTQANTTVIAAALRPHQGVLCAETGHINVHESGAIESTGHKVLGLPACEGKITAEQIDGYCQAHYDDAAWEHMVQPGMVYLSLPTELGTVYTLAELEAISRTCRKWKLPLFVDGARLACGLAASDVTLPDLARLCDVFYLGTQYEAFLTDSLFLEIGKKEVAQALRLRAAFEEKGYPLFVNSPTNQQFPVLPNRHMAALEEKYSFEVWARVDEGHTAVRFCTSWSTTDGDVDALITDIQKL